MMILGMRRKHLLTVSGNRVGCPQRGDVDVEHCCMCSWCDYTLTVPSTFAIESVDADEDNVTAVHCSYVSRLTRHTTPVA
jgi:hypothetical protein